MLVATSRAALSGPESVGVLWTQAALHRIHIPAYIVNMYSLLQTSQLRTCSVCCLANKRRDAGRGGHVSAMLILTESQVRSCLPVALAIDASAHAFYTAAHGTSDTPSRLILTLPPVAPSTTPTHSLFKPCLTPSALGIKLVSVRPNNAALSLPTVPASVLLIDREQGHVVACMGGTSLTAMRTAAGSAVASRLFAREDATELSVFGAGAQAEQHIVAMLAVRPSIHTVHVINRSSERAQQLLDRLQPLHPPVQFHCVSPPSSDPSDAVTSRLLEPPIGRSQLICLCTNSATPLLQADWVQPGTHINAVGSYTANATELPIELVARCAVVVDSEEAWNSGELAQALQAQLIDKHHVQGVLGAYLDERYARWPVAGEAAEEKQCDGVRVLQCSESRISLFKSVGTAVQDVVTAHAVYEEAKKRGIGLIVDMDK